MKNFKLDKLMWRLIFLVVAFIVLASLISGCTENNEALPGEAEGAYVVLTLNAQIERNDLLYNALSTNEAMAKEKLDLELKVSEQALLNELIEKNNSENIGTAVALANQLTEIAYTPTPEPTQEGYTNLKWRDAVVMVKELTLHRPRTEINKQGNEIIMRNNNGLMMLEGVPRSDLVYLEGQHMVIVYDRIAVDGGNVYYVVGPSGNGLYVNILHVRVLESGQ